MGFCEDVSKVGDDLGEGCHVGDVEEDIFAVKKNTCDDKIVIGDAPSDIVQHGGDSKDKKPNSEDLASRNKKKGGKNHQVEEEDMILAELGAAAPQEKLPNQPAKHEEVTLKKKKKMPEETKNERNSKATLPQFTVIEVKVVQGTIDVVLVNGMLCVGDCIVVAGFQGPVVTSISALLTPHPVKKLRRKGEYLHHKKIKISQGIKIAAPGLEQAIAGASLYVVRPNDDIEVIKKSAMEYVDSVMSRIDKSGEGVYVQASTLWSVDSVMSRFTYSEEVKCTVLDVVKGYETSIDVVLVNGVLHEGDQIVVGGLQGPVVTSIRALLTPHPMRELRVEGTYVPYKEIKAAQCIKIAAQGLEHAIAGASLYVVWPNDDIEVIKKSAMEYVDSVMSRIDKSGEGVYVQASTLWSVEALLDFLKTPEVNIPVSRISIGAVQKMDVMRVSARKKEYATILAYGVEVTPEAYRLAQQFGVKIFTADIIYHLFDQFKAYMDNFKEEKKREAPEAAVFPCVLKIMPNRVFSRKDPIILGVHVVEGIAKIGTPICVPGRKFVEIGWIVCIRDENHRVVDYAKKGQRVTINILGSNLEEREKMFGRHFEMEDELVSKITSDSVNALMKHYSDDLSIEDRRLVWKLIQLFRIGDYFGN